jgi:XTP/dITP diphosphohydrolase
LTKDKLLLATTNPGKAKEMRAFLSQLPFEVFSLSDAGISERFIETGKTFLENARGKSQFYSQFWDGLTLGEDSGLNIDYLNGAPGIFSARYSGPQADDEKNIQKVLKKMKNVPDEKRQAQFVSSMVLSKREDVMTEIQESAEGFITHRKIGNHGFGYDPIFFFPALNKTFAELEPEQKIEVSHRGKSLKQLKAFLHSYQMTGT